MANKRTGWLALAGLGGLAALLWGRQAHAMGPERRAPTRREPLLAIQPPTSHSIVTDSVKSRRLSLNTVWTGETPPPTYRPVPKFKVGEQVMVYEPAQPPDQPADGPLHGQLGLVQHLLAQETVELTAADGATGAYTPVKGAPIVWAYQVKVGGQERDIAEQSLRPPTFTLDVKKVSALMTPVQPPTAPAATPWYMPGLTAKFGSMAATILKAWQDGQGVWHYQINLKAGLPFGVGDGEHAISQVKLREQLASKLGPMAADQAYPVGLTIFRNGQGGLVQSVTPDPAGGWRYQLQGWPSVVTQDVLLKLLGK